MLVPPFVQLRFKIWQLTGVDPQITFGWRARGRTRFAAWWDVVGTMAAAGGLGWYSNSEPATATRIFLPVALFAVALIVVGVFRHDH
jgi:hypothetical protein